MIVLTWEGPTGVRFSEDNVEADRAEVKVWTLGETARVRLQYLPTGAKRRTGVKLRPDEHYLLTPHLRRIVRAMSGGGSP